MNERNEPYNPHAIETRWQQRWAETALYRTPAPDGRPTFYCLDFFPYPSGAGLSVGHCRNYVPTDVISRYQRQRGRAVLHPMGWDAFGLPAENEAIDKGVHPRDSTERYAANYKRQMSLIGASYDWEREINSSHPDYYRWTQWIFLLLHRQGLAYQAMAPVNWCASCQTTLANEEVEGGACWRCHQPVRRRDLKQWFLRITAYAEELLAETDNLDWPEHILAMQRHWIGASEGVEFQMEVAGHPGSAFRVFTTRPDTVYGMTFAVLAPEHPLLGQIVSPGQRAEVEAYVERSRTLTEVERQSTERRRDGVWTGAYAVNPMNGQPVPVFGADYVLGSYGTGAIMAVPAHDQRDYEFARRYGLPIVQVIRGPEGEDTAGDQAYEGDGIMVGSGPFDGQPSTEAWQGIARAMEEAGAGRRTVQYRMRDWLISRQRYWGAPIPMVHCAGCGTVAVPEEDLPVRLPHLPDYLPRGDGRSPLANLPGFVETTCPACGGPARRETDTMGGFACSSWYFLRFADPWYDAGPFNPEAVRRWLPVDLYVGGAEHAVMHLLYARFWTKVLADAGLIDFREPFPRLRSQGIVHADDGKRMSKSRGNVVTPDEVVARYGADILRLHLLFMAPFDRNVNWDEDGIAGAERFLQRVWRLGEAAAGGPAGDSPVPAAAAASGRDDDLLLRAMHKTIRRVTEDVEAFKFNTAVSAMMEMSNTLAAHREGHGPSTVFCEAFEVLVRLLAPFAPHIAEELWARLGQDYSVHQQAWPAYDPALAVDETVTLVVQVNGKVRERITVPAGLDDDQARQRAMESERVRQHLDGRTPRQVFVVSGRLVNVVT
ncbi:MAG TPA: leucine--tRNA ligase [Anaerolineae bacterium]|nr:leucine--tRNA ligase [Anaerolineae bacterium]